MKNNMRNFFKKNTLLKFIVINIRILRNRHSIIDKIKKLCIYYKDLYRLEKTHPKFEILLNDLYPCIYDKTETTPVGAVYFYQDSWCARKIFETKPIEHFDIGSKAEMVGIISQFTPTTMIDIRPITLTLPDLSFIEGNILKLPFEDKTIPSLSSICVVEHIGLGRYGDTLDPFGSEKAIKELIRVLAPRGNLFISVPIDTVNKIYFNAHRAFTREYILELFEELNLIEERYIYGDHLQTTYEPKKGFGTGLYYFRRS